MENREQEHQHKQDVENTEFAQEIISNPNQESNVAHHENRQDRTDEGYGWGIAGIVLSVLAFFLWPYLFAPIGIILGVVGVSRKNNLGWWAIAIGVIALILITVFNILAIPFRILF